jgi:hypothetical protein
MKALKQALDELLGTAVEYDGASSIVVEVRIDGRADVDFLNAHRHLIHASQYYRDDDGEWVLVPRSGGLR